MKNDSDFVTHAELAKELARFNSAVTLLISIMTQPLNKYDAQRLLALLSPVERTEGCTCIIVNSQFRSTSVDGCPVHNILPQRVSSDA